MTPPPTPTHDTKQPEPQPTVDAARYATMRRDVGNRLRALHGL